MSLVAMGLCAALTANGATVALPAGSVDGLAAAIAAAGPRGTVIVESGVHYESTSVVIDISVAVIGGPGAVIEGTTTPNNDGTSPDNIDPVFHVMGTRGARVEGLEIRPAGATGNTGFLIQNAPRTTIRGNVVSDHEFGVVLQGGDHTVIADNLFQDPVLFGILSINGSHVRISGNTIVGAGIYGVWLCDTHGQFSFNSIRQCFIGVLLCRLADGTLILPDGSADGAPSSASRWFLVNNESYDNEVFGYLVTDGANHNLLANNAARNNGELDILLDSEFNEPPEYAPPSFNNVVALGRYRDLSVEDLGVDNLVVGGR